MIREVSRKQLSEQFAAGPSVFLLAPNYEERSIGSSLLLQELLQIHASADVGVHWVTIQTRSSRDLLDTIKSENLSRARSLVTSDRARKSTLWMGEVGAIETIIAETTALCREVSDDTVDLYLDISGMPRSYVSQIFSHYTNGWSGSGRRTTRRMANLYLMYTPARSYAPTVGIDSLGSVKGSASKRHFLQMVETLSDIDLVLFASGNQHDAAQTHDVLRSLSATINIRETIFAFMNIENLLYSYRHISESSWLFQQSYSESKVVSYVFDYVDAARHLEENLAHVLTAHLSMDQKSGVLPGYFIAPFGPKPLGVLAEIAVAHYKREIEEKTSFVPQADILHIGGFQYTSLYSMGRMPTKVYKLELPLQL